MKNRMRFDDLFMVVHDMMSSGTSDDELKSLLFACGWTPYEYTERVRRCILAEEHVRIFQHHVPGRSN